MVDVAQLEDELARVLSASPRDAVADAEVLQRAGAAGRADPAAEVYAQVKADTPDDVWLYNSAGLEYAAAGDPQQALDWFTEGLQLALDTGDPENLVAQLQALRGEQLND